MLIWFAPLALGIFPVSVTPTVKTGTLDFMDVWYPIQVKQKDGGQAGY